MKNLAVSVFLLLGSLMLVACESGPIIEGSGDIVSETREVSEFSGVQINGAADVIVTYGAEQAVSVVGDDNVVPIITTDVSSDMLVIGSDEPYTTSEPVRVEIVLPTFRSIGINGSGDVEVRGSREGTDSIERFAVSIDGSGDVDVDDMRSKTVDVDIDGSGDVNIAGKGEEIDVRIEGSGTITMIDFAARIGTATIEGSGTIIVFVTESLEAVISGSGSIFYRGDPADVDESISGSSLFKAYSLPLTDTLLPMATSTNTTPSSEQPRMEPFCMVPTLSTSPMTSSPI